MNASKYIIGIAMAALAVMLGCKKEEYNDVSFVQTANAPDKLSAFFDITQDNTGLVTITPNGEGASSYQIYYGDNTTTPVSIAPGKNTQHVYAEGVYNVKIVAKGLNGKTTEATKQLTVSFKAPENLEVTAAADASNQFKYTVSAKANYETVFKVYFGDVANEVPQSFLEGETISHTYASVGTYTIKVVALSGGAATTEFTKQITIVDPVLLPLTFESATLIYEFSNFDGGNTTVIANPHAGGINTSAKVGKMVKNPGQVWGGSVIRMGAPIDFSTNKIFRMKVYSPRVGAKVLLKVENPSDGSISFEKEAVTTVANAWEELGFDYSAINTSNVYQNIVLIFELGTVGDGSANFTFLFDDIRLTNSMPVPPGAAPISLPVTFDDPGVNYTVTDFGNNQTVDAVDPDNASNKVKKTTKLNGAETWAGTTIGTPVGFATPIPVTATSSKMSIRVYSPAAGIHVRLKIEDHNDNTRSVETEAITSAANAWETLVFDFNNQAAGTAAFNSSYTYDKASVFFDFNVAGNGKVFYWDDVMMAAAAPSSSSLGLPLDFQSATLNYTFTNFDGGNVTVVNNPDASGINTSTKVAKMVKNAGQPWAGSYITLDNPIDFSTQKTVKMKVYSPRVGAKVLLKVENLTNGGISYEKEVTTTTANAWEELTFDYSGINTANSYQKVVLIFDNGTMGDGSANFTYYFDDIRLN
ncbi:hypothetical protein [Flavisolibacter ginsengisoli]|jgi:hypothetical protein|uniref:PKD/Chitinase domain-containing protein n=1 Tax=Flavisolibacter ginsengisoli DSM 18119 TaxID=1121884 RepID=A0A1M4X827_9BACT|nr:hypothetical protein [Flavisolibacter ginsengisoli]SHE89690.1 hypothetical protein SAMN02745131_01378 [Flavisolibacter ginsengisoli DSM 18119]